MGIGLAVQGDGSTQTDPSDINGIIQSAAGQYGVDPAYLARVAQIESSNDPKATSKTGAKGLFQFTGGTSSQYGLRNPYDPAQSANAAARLTADNQASLTKALGRAPTSAELYLAHQQGAAGAAALLKNPGANAVDALAPVYGGSRTRAAQALTVNGGSPDMTAGAFAGKWAAKFAPQGNNAQPGNNAPVQPATPDANAPGAPLSLAQAAAAPTAAQSATKTAQSKFGVATGIGNKISSAFTTGISAAPLMQLSDTPASVSNLWPNQIPSV